MARLSYQVILDLAGFPEYSRFSVRLQVICAVDAVFCVMRPTVALLLVTQRISSSSRKAMASSQQQWSKYLSDWFCVLQGLGLAW